jgi:hypothetical protein
MVVLMVVMDLVWLVRCTVVIGRQVLVRVQAQERSVKRETPYILVVAVQVGHTRPLRRILGLAVLVEQGAVALVVTQIQLLIL